MNRKGQVLVAFIILLPVLFIVFALIIDLGNLYIEKRKIDNNIKDVIEYSLNNIEENKDLENKIKNQLNLNIDNIQYLDIKINDKIIEIKLEKTNNSIFSTILNVSNLKISSHYKGYINDDKIVIRKEGN